MAARRTSTKRRVREVAQYMKLILKMWEKADRSGDGARTDS